MIKVEPPGSGDGLRQIGVGRGGLSAIFSTLNRGKRFVEVTTRLRHGRELAEILDARTEKHSTAELSRRLEAEVVPHAPVNTLERLHEDPQLIENGTLVELDHPQAGRSRTPRPVARFSATPAAIQRPVPALGAHGAEVLGEAGLEAREIEALRRAGILG